LKRGISNLVHRLSVTRSNPTRGNSPRGISGFWGIGIIDWLKLLEYWSFNIFGWSCTSLS